MTTIELHTETAAPLGNAGDICMAEFTKSATELFEYYGGERPSYHSLHSSYSTLLAETKGELACSSIGLGSDRCRCSIGLLAPVNSLPLLQVGSNSPTDWIGELTNQLGGRFKNQLHAYGIEMQLGLPMSLKGEKICFAWNDAEYFQFRFLTPHGAFMTAIQINVDETDVWNTDNPIKVSEEGSLELF